MGVSNPWRDSWFRLRKNVLALLGLAVVSIFLLAATIGRTVTPYDFLTQDMSNQLQAPSATHWLGTDVLGRDIFSRLLYGARTALVVALTTVTISVVIGVIVGATSGYLGGTMDELLMWFTDLTMSIPSLLLAMLINTALKRPIANWFDRIYEQTRYLFFANTLWLDFVLVFGALALISWPAYARIIRGQVLAISETTYVESARASGASVFHILWHHVLPNSAGPLIVAVTAGIGGAIVLESSLSFLGIGIQPPNASWGSMLAESLKLWRSVPHLMVAPAATIGLLQIAFTFLGDGLNDALNPKLK